MLCLSGCELYSRWVLLIAVGNRVKIYNVACKKFFFLPTKISYEKLQTNV